jgi:hypothetical protein
LTPRQITAKPSIKPFDLSDRVLLGVLGQMGVANRGQNRLMPENLLDLNQIDSRFDQVRGIAMA